MAKPGPAPKPTALRKLAGNPSHRPLNKHEASVPSGMPTCPTHICPEGKREWNRVAGRLKKYGLLTTIDRAALAAYCQAYGRWVQAEHELEKTGGDMICYSPNGYPMQNPLISIANGAMKMMLDALAEFGMTPSSRSKVKAEKPQEVDELEALFARVGKHVRVTNG